MCAHEVEFIAVGSKSLKVNFALSILLKKARVLEIFEVDKVLSFAELLERRVEFLLVVCEAVIAHGRNARLDAVRDVEKRAHFVCSAQSERDTLKTLFKSREFAANPSNCLAADVHVDRAKQQHEEDYGDEKRNDELQSSRTFLILEVGVNFSPKVEV